MQTTATDHVYVYGALEGRAATLPAEGMPEGRPPRLAPITDGLALIVSNVPASSYNRDALQTRLGDVEWVSTAAAAHHAVVDAITEQGATVLPFGVFTVFSNEPRALAAVRDAIGPIGEALERVRGRQEWALRITRPDQALIARDEPAAAAASGTSFLAAKAAMRRRDAERAGRVAEDTEAAYHALERLAEAAKRTALDRGENLLLDAAFLVPPAAVDALKRALTDAAGQLLRDGCRVSLTGPWPPYSFSYVGPRDDA